MSTASASGRSSRISSPIVPFPAITCSFWTGWMKTPSASAKLDSSIACHHRSYGTLITRPPSRSIAANFVSAAPSGTMTAEGIPSSRAAQATPWPMLPALAVTTPACSSSAGSCEIAFSAPRSLKEPIGCRFSSFR